MAITVNTTTSGNLDGLIEPLRLRMGDITVPYRYTDDWMQSSLVGAVGALTNWGGFKYYSTENDAVRKPSARFQFAEPPVIERGDEEPIIIKAAMILVRGSLESFTWNLQSWRDAEGAFSNIQGGKSKQFNYESLEDELMNYLKPPQKTLQKGGKKTHLPGYLKNDYENRDNLE